MSQLKDFSQISQEQVLAELHNFDLKPEVLVFLKAHPAIVKPLLEIGSELENLFPDHSVDFNSFDEAENCLLLLINVPDITADVIIRFNDFKKVWRSEKYEVLQETVILGIKVIGSEFVNPRKDMLDLVSSGGYPPDYAAEIDHYLYGTPKRYQ